jgi:hypothetical protein
MTGCDVLIIGAVPVGLTLAIDLAWRTSTSRSWTRDRLPDDPAGLIDCVRGAAHPKLARQDTAS